MTNTPEQDVIYGQLRSGRNLMVRAVAGSGKTTTIVECCRRLTPADRPLFLAFNRSIADELQERLPYFAAADTFHTFCLNAIRRTQRVAPPDGRKCAKLLRALVPNFRERRDYGDDLLKLVGLAKGAPQADLADLADAYALQAPLAVAEEILRLSLADRGTLDFDDMLLHAWHYGVAFDRYGYIFVDEAQDLNWIQQELLWRLQQPGFTVKESSTRWSTGQTIAKPDVVIPSPTRFVAVGDPNQAIYGFRGADAAGMDTLKRRFDMEELPLSVSWRCSRAVVREAQKFEGA